MPEEDEFKNAISFVWKLHLQAAIIGIVGSILITRVFKDEITMLPGLILGFLLYKLFGAGLKWANQEDYAKHRKVVEAYIDENSDTN